MSTADILINSGYLLTLIALSIKEVLWLRVVLTCSHCMIFVNNFFISGNYTTAKWNMVFIAINIIQIIKIYNDRKPRLIPDQFKDLYNEIFGDFTSKEFLYFIQMGDVHKVSDKKIIDFGSKQEDLLLILNGSASVKREEQMLATLNRGQFIAEISFLTSQPASADVYAEETLEYISWNQNKIKAIKESNNPFWVKLNSVLTNDLTTKISK